MISSYQLSRSFSPRSILWDVCGALFNIGRVIVTIVGQGRRVASHIDIGALFLGLLIVAGACGLIAAVAFIVANPLVIVGAGIIAAYGWATYPRPKVVAK